MKYAVIGARGFIGQHLCRRARAAGAGVLGFDVTEGPDPGFEVRTANAVIDPIEIPAGVDAVFYLAQSPRYRSFPDGAGELFAVSVVGALRCAEAAARAGARLFCHTSTGNVYQPGFEPLAEGRPVRRDIPYAASKVAAEEALALMSGAMQVVSVRLFGVFGPGQREGLVPGLVKRIREGRPVELEPSARIPADQEGLRLSLTFVEDVAGCLLRIAELAVEGRTIPSPLNVAGPRALSIRELAGQLGVHLGLAPGYRVLNRTRDTDYVADIQRLEQLVGPVFTPLEEAIARTVDEKGAGQDFRRTTDSASRDAGGKSCPAPFSP